MPRPIKRDASFIIRIWWERRSQESAVWRGQIIHVQTGQSRFLQNESTLIGFIRRWSGAADARDDEGMSSFRSSEEESP